MIECVFVEVRYQEGFVRNLRLFCGQSVTIGREVGDLVFAHDLEMSGIHLQIEVNEAECRITDLESTNSTWLNESGIQTATVQDGDILRAGKTTFSFQIQHANSPGQQVDGQENSANDDAPFDPDSGQVNVPQPPTTTENSWRVFLDSSNDLSLPADVRSAASNDGLVRESKAGSDPEATMCERDMPLAAPLQIEISLIEGQAAHDNYVLDAAGSSSLLIGREDPSDFKVNDEKVSAQHCRILQVDHTFVVRDLDSTNGTMLNGQEITEARISDGDELQFGDTKLTIRFRYER